MQHLNMYVNRIIHNVYAEAVDSYICNVDQVFVVMSTVACSLSIVIDLDTLFFTDILTKAINPFTELLVIL